MGVSAASGGALAAADPTVEAAELTLLAVLAGSPTTGIGDYVFGA